MKVYSNNEDVLLAYKFATYAVATNRLYLKKLKDNEKIPDLGPGVSQYIVIDYNSDAEKKFELNKKKV